MSWQEGEGYDPADEVDGSTNPLADYAESAYLTAAAGYVVMTEEQRGHWHDSRLSADNRDAARERLDVATRLAELNIRMAAACGAYQDRQPRVEMKTGWLTDAVGDTMANTPEFRAWAEAQIGVPKVKTPDEVAAEIREQVQADAEAHQAETLRPRADPEPEAEGELWTPADHPKSGEWFAYATNAELGTARWLIIESYAGYLRWRDDASLGVANEPVTWPHLGDNTRAVFRRPTAAERAAFYGPEPDPTPAGDRSEWVGGNVPAVCGECGIRHSGECVPEFLRPGPRGGSYSEGAARALERCSKSAEAAGKTRTAQWLYACAAASRRGIVDWPPAPAYKGTVVHLDDLEPDLQSLGGEALRKLYESVKRERTRRGYDPAPEPSGFDQSPRPRGGAAQWREG